MPLVVPGLTSNSGSDDKNAHWTSQLMGKKIGESHNETTFAKSDLPKEHRVFKSGDMLTKDHKPDRLNVETDNDGTVRKVHHG